MRILAARDFKVKYKQSVLGPLWLVFQPMALLAGFWSPSGASRSRDLRRSVRGVRARGAQRLVVLPGVDDDRDRLDGHELRPSSASRPARARLPDRRRDRLAAGVRRHRRCGALVARPSRAISPPRVLLLPLALLWLLALTLGVVAISRR